MFWHYNFRCSLLRLWQRGRMIVLRSWYYKKYHARFKSLLQRQFNQLQGDQWKIVQFLAGFFFSFFPVWSQLLEDHRPTVSAFTDKFPLLNKDFRVRQSDAWWNILLMLFVSGKEMIPLCKQTCLSYKCLWDTFFLKWEDIFSYRWYKLICTMLKQSCLKTTS